MSNLSQFQSFVKRSNKAIIYTRVANKLQKDNTKILQQKQHCLLKVEHLKLEVKKCFGGTLKSGLQTQTDIEEMIAYAKAHHISAIIVYTYDCLTRKNLFSTLQKIEKLGIQIITVIQPKVISINLSKRYLA